MREDITYVTSSPTGCEFALLLYLQLYDKFTMKLDHKSLGRQLGKIFSF